MENNFGHPLADADYHGHAFEGLILFLLRTFCRPTVLSPVFKFQGTIPILWADILLVVSEAEKCSFRDFPILRSLAGFSLPANLNLTADSVKQALSDLGQPPLPLHSFGYSQRQVYFTRGGQKFLAAHGACIARKRGLEMILH